jgi:hypothetical protein
VAKVAKRLGVCATVVLLAAGVVGAGAPTAQAAPKLDVCALIPIAEASAVGGQPLVVNQTPLPKILTSQKDFLGECTLSGANPAMLDGTDPPLFLPTVTALKYSAATWKQRILTAKQSKASAKKVSIPGASKAVQLVGKCPPQTFDETLVKVGKRLFDVKVNPYFVSCPPPHSVEYAKVVVSHL